MRVFRLPSAFKEAEVREVLPVVIEKVSAFAERFSFVGGRDYEN